MAADLEPSSAEVGRGERKGVLPAGTRLGKYELTSVLGQGGFGITYQAHDSVLSRNLAIKEYLPTSIAVREGGTTVVPRSTEHASEFVWGRDRFVEEARTLARLDRASAIVRVYDFLEANGTAYMVMALAEGETLAQRLRRAGPISPQEAERLLFPLQAGLEQVHAAGYLHRDIKPANIIIDESGTPTLIDFGASRASVADRSVSMTAIFTPGYAAIEQFTSAKQGPWTDIYGLSATIYHALTGRTPPSAIERILDDEYVPLSQLNITRLPRSFSMGVDVGMSLKAAERPQTIGEWRKYFEPSDLEAERQTVVLKDREQFRQVADRGAVKNAPTSGGSVAGKPKSARNLLWAGVAAGAIAAVGGGSVAIWGVPWSAKRTVVVQDLQVEDLQKLLDERKKADEAAAEKRRLEEEARLKADEDARRKRQAEAEFAEAQLQRQKAEQELARLKADIEEKRKKDEADKQGTAEIEARRAAELEAQQKVEAEMAALQKAEGEARQKVAAEAEAKRKADEDFAKAQAERQQAEEAARRAAAEAEAKRKADEEARQKAEAAAEAKRKADEEARLKAEAAAEAKRKADEEANQKAAAAAEAKKKAEEEAKQKAEAAAEAKRKADEEAKRKAEADAAALAEKKAAEAVENGLKLSLQDRQKIQIALTAAGFDTRGTDGVFGQRSRDMIAAWQKTRSKNATGYLTADEQQALVKEAAAAITKFEEEQKKAEADKKAADDAKKKADDEARAKADLEAKKKADTEAQKQVLPSAAPQQALAVPQTPPSAAGFDGVYSGGFAFPNQRSASVRLTVSGSTVTGTVTSTCSTEKASLSVDAFGNISGQLDAATYMSCGPAWTFQVKGKVDGSGTMQLQLWRMGGTLGGGGAVTLKRGG